VWVFLFALTACKPNYAVGDHVLVEWEGNVYPAVVVKVKGPGKYQIHYDGYEDTWDEEVPRARIKGLVEGDVVNPEPPAKVREKALKAAQTNKFKIGDQVRVEWHGRLYNAQITAIVGREKYRIHYEGYGSEWDENVGLDRIQPR
jgi:hypothetical protein